LKTGGEKFTQTEILDGNPTKIQFMQQKKKERRRRRRRRSASKQKVVHGL
jgi:hypothetical protein